MPEREIDYDRLEQFLKGNVSQEDLATRRFNRFDIIAMAHAMVVARLDELAMEADGMCYAKQSLERTFNKVFPLHIHSAHIDASRQLGLHWSTKRHTTRLTYPDKFIRLVERYKDDPHGGIAVFAAAKHELTKGNSDIDGISAEEIATDVATRLRGCYSREVLNIIRDIL